MLKTLLALATVFTLFQVRGYHFTTRDDIINEYQPILTEKSVNLTSESLLVNEEYTLVIDQIKNNTWTAVSVMNTQIAVLKTGINNAKTASAKKPEVLNCIKPYETEAGLLSAAPINSTCWVGVTYPDMLGVENAFRILAKVPNVTISACTNLDPLPSQDELFVRCIADKILDLDEKVLLLKSDFEGAKRETVDKSVHCLADQSALIVEKIDEISFQVKLCLVLQ